MKPTDTDRFYVTEWIIRTISLTDIANIDRRCRISRVIIVSQLAIVVFAPAFHRTVFF